MDEWDTECPRCGQIVWVVVNWESGECPTCKLKYYWDEMCTEDYTDCWPELYWDEFERSK